MQMYDSIQPLSIPATAPMVGGYVDGIYAGPRYWGAPGAWNRFPNAAKRRIACVSTTVGDTFDVEKFDLTPAEAPIAVHNALMRGERNLWVYCNRDNQRITEDELWNFGITVGEVSMWIATLDGTTSVPRYRYPIAAVQYKDVGPYDLSEVFTLMTHSEKRVHVRHAYNGGLGREPSETEIEEWATKIADDGSNVDSVCGSIYDSVEGQAWKVKLHSVGTIPPGTTITGTFTGATK